MTELEVGRRVPPHYAGGQIIGEMAVLPEPEPEPAPDLRDMVIVDGKPPLWNEIVRAFPGAARPGVIFAWGDRIYAPGRPAVDPALYVHECLHGERQRAMTNAGVEGWWRSYIYNAGFRLDEEIRAHIAELGFRSAGNRLDRRAALAEVSARLAAPLYRYGHLMNTTKARALLKRVMATAA